MTRISARELSGTEGPFGRGVPIVRPVDVPEGSVVTVLRVPPELAGMRLDRFVQTQLKRTSRTRAKQIVLKGAYAPDARLLKANMRVHAEQCILLWRPPWDEKAEPLELPILLEDDDLLAINKPPKVPVHPTARYHKSTVIKRLEAERPDERLYLAHRLDRETSGVLLLSKNLETDRNVKFQFARESKKANGLNKGAGIRKTYVAIAHNTIPEDHVRVELPLELDPESKYKVKMRVAQPGEGLAASTVFDVLGRRRSSVSGKTYSLLSCLLETGRQHQIRVHASALGMPLVGDKLYGSDDGLFARDVDGLLTECDREILELDRHALHASTLELDHPRNNSRIRIEAPLPRDMREFWQALTA